MVVHRLRSIHLLIPDVIEVLQGLLVLLLLRLLALAKHIALVCWCFALELLQSDVTR